MYLEEMLLNETKRLQGIKKKVDKSLKNMPEGELRIKSSKRQRLYQITKTNPNGEKVTRYAHSNELQLLKALAQRDYEKKVQKLVDERLKQISILAGSYRDNELDDIFEKLCESRKCLVQAVEPTLRQKTEEWCAEKYEGKGFYDDKPEIYTKRGERVRSKSEKIIADMLADAGLNYRYEYPLFLDDYIEVFPDFTILHPVTMKEIIWEHFGLMSDPDYAAKALRKIDSYIKKGYYLGDRLIVTFEGNGTDLDVKSIEKMIEHYFFS